jgi:hypothetical protein
MAKKPKDIWGVSIPSAQDVVNYLNNAVNQGRVASGDKAAVLPGDQGVRNLGRGISLTNDYLNPYANTTKQLLGMAAGNEGAQEKFAKSLAKDVAITGAAVGVGKGIVKGAQMASQSVKQGIKAGTYVNPSAAIRNIKEGNKIVIHSSPRTELPVLEPHFGSMAMPNERVLFSWNPRVGRRMDRGNTVIDRNIINYTNPRAPKGGVRPEGEKPGSVYVAKVPLDLTGPVRPSGGKPVAYQNRMVVTKGQGEIIKEIPAPDLSDSSAARNYFNFRDELARELRKAGVRPKGIPTAQPSLISRFDKKSSAIVDDLTDTLISKFKKPTRR